MSKREGMYDWLCVVSASVLFMRVKALSEECEGEWVMVRASV